MYYTYDNFVAEANKAGLMNQFSKQDLQIAQRNPEFGISLLGLLKDNAGASTAEQRLLATEAANQLRKSYGVYNTGNLGESSAYAGSYGSQINDLMEKINNYGSFDYAGKDEYRKLLDSIVNQQPFSYDLQDDPSWGSYKKAYMREGDRASANALAQASAASGGRPSSYAQTAAQQAGNYYAGQLADIIPTLEENAYSRYLSDFNNRLNGLGALQSDRNFDYENWMNEYNMLQNSLGNYQNQDATDYQRYLDAYDRAYQAEQDRLAQSLKAQAGGGIDGGNPIYNDDQGSSGSAGGAALGALAGLGTGAGGNLVDDMIDELQGSGGQKADTGNYTVTNRNGDGWVAVGGGRMTWTELERAVNQGQIIEVIDPEKGTITYTYPSKNNSSGEASSGGTKGSGASRAPRRGGNGKFSNAVLD